MSVEGVDYAWARPTVAGLVAAGKHFACRYGGPGSAGKQLDPAEARALNVAGIAIVANAEGAANGLQGFAAGADWARSADQHFRGCGMPADRPIYLSADFDCTAGQWPNVAAALRGAASVLGTGRVGVYGGYDVMVWSRRDSVADWFWQTYAWSEGRWAPGNHIEQYKNGVTLAGGTVDLDRALTADYGQWGVDDMTVTDEDAEKIAAKVWTKFLGSSGPTAGVALQTSYGNTEALNDTKVPALQADVDALQTQITGLAAQLTAQDAKLDQILAGNGTTPAPAPTAVTGTFTGQIS